MCKLACSRHLTVPDIRRLAVIERLAAYAAESCASSENARCMAEFTLPPMRLELAKGCASLLAAQTLAVPDIRRLAVIERLAAYAAESCASSENARCMAELLDTPGHTSKTVKRMRKLTNVQDVWLNLEFTNVI